MSKKQTTSEDSPLIGVLKEAVRNCGLSLADVAKKSGVSLPQLWRFMKGERTLTLPVAEKLMTFLGLTVAKSKGKAK